MMSPDAPVKRIVALAPNWLGDAAMSTPALRALHTRFPDASLTVVGNPAVCALLDDLPWISHRVPVPGKASLGQLFSHARELRPHGRDVVVVFPHSFRAALLAWLLHGRTRIGYRRNGRAWLLTESATPPRENGRITPVYMAREYLDLVALVGCEDDGKGLELGAPADLMRQTRAHLAGDGVLIGLAPGAAFGPSKRWMPERFAAAAALIAAQRPARFVLLTGPGEEALRDAVIAHGHIPFLMPPETNRGIAALKAAIAQLDLLICNDSGPRHIAIAFKRPVVCIMGPTSPNYTDSPYERGRVLRIALECSPCQAPVCPLGHHRCMRDIQPEHVADAALEYLSSIDNP